MPDKIIALTGPAGSGKSTVAKLLCKKFDKCVRLDIDRIKHLIENGFVYDDSPEGKDQWTLLSKNIVDLCKNFQKEGYDIIIEGYIDLESPGWPEVFSELDARFRFLLLPSQEAIKSRDKMRIEDFQMGDEALERHYKYFSENSNVDKLGFFIIDSSEQTVDETAEIIFKKI